MTTLFCNVCKKNLDVSNFWRKNNRKTGYERQCKHCKSDRYMSRQKDSRDTKPAIEKVFHQWVKT